MAASCLPKRQMVTSGLPSGRSLCQGQALTWQALLQQAVQQVLTRNTSLPTATAAAQHQSWQQATPPGDDSQPSCILLLLELCPSAEGQHLSYSQHTSWPRCTGAASSDQQVWRLQDTPRHSKIMAIAAHILGPWGIRRHGRVSTHSPQSAACSVTPNAMLLRCRDKARQLFSDGLQMALPDVPGGDVAFASAEVECAMYAASGGVNKEYMKISRRLSFNIKDANNPDLRRKVLAGDVTGKPSPRYARCRLHVLHVCHTVRALMVSVWKLCHGLT